MITKVEGWETQDGKFFKDEDDAKMHGLSIANKIKRQATLDNKSEWIRQYVAEGVADEGYTLEDIGKPFCEGDHGWDCEADLNPIDKCVYVTYDGCYEESCVFCGQPEERK